MQRSTRNKVGQSSDDQKYPVQFFCSWHWSISEALRETQSAQNRRVIRAHLAGCCQNRVCWALTETKKVIWSAPINSQHAVPSQRRTFSPKNYFLRFLRPVVVCNVTAVLISTIIRQVSNRMNVWMKKQQMFLYITFVDVYSDAWTLSVSSSVVHFPLWWHVDVSKHKV